MKGIIHVICNGGQEHWIDGQGIVRMEKSWLDFRTNGPILTIYNDGGNTMKIHGVVLVEILEAKPKTVEIIPNKEEGEKTTSTHGDILDQRMINFSLSVRTLTILHQAKVDTVRDLVRLNKIDILKIRNAGRKTLAELDDFICDHNLNWGMDV